MNKYLPFLIFTFLFWQCGTESDYEYNLGVKFAKKSNYDSAVFQYSRALDINPKHVFALYNRGFAKVKLEQFKSGIEDYNAAIKLNKYFWEAYFSKSIALFMIQEFKNSMIDVNRAIELEPNNGELYFHRGTISDALGLYSDAINDFNIAINIDDHKSNYYYNRALTKTNLNDFEGAVNDYGIAISIDPIFYDAYHNRAMIYMDYEMYKEAIESLSEYPGSTIDHRAIRLLGICEYFDKDYHGALRRLNRSIEMDDQNSASYFYKGLCERALGNEKEGCEYLILSSKMGFAAATDSLSVFCAEKAGNNR